MTIREITEEIGSLYERMKSAVEKAQGEGKPMNGEEKMQYEQNNARLTDLITMRDQHYNLLDVQSRANSQREAQKSSMAQARGLSLKEERKVGKFLDGDEYRSAFLRYLAVGQKDLTDSEQRAMTEGSDGDGGYLPSTDFYATLIEKRLLANAMRGISNVMPLGTFKTDVVIESGYGTAAYVGEGVAAAESSPTFTNLILKPYTMRYFTKVSNELIADAPSRGPAFSIESILSKQIGKVMGEKEEDAFVQGDGSGKPKGIFAYAADDSAARRIATATSNVVTLSELLNFTYALPRQYRTNARWVMTDSVFAKIRALVQTTSIATASGSALSVAPFAWTMGLNGSQGAEPDRLFGFPVVCVAQGPAYPAAGTARDVIAFGDFQYYHIGERESVSIKVARETFLANNQTGYFAFARHDGQVSIKDAFRYLQIKA